MFLYAGIRFKLLLISVAVQIVPAYLNPLIEINGKIISSPSQGSVLLSLPLRGQVSSTRLFPNYQATTGKTLNTQFVSLLSVESFAAAFYPSPKDVRSSLPRQE